MPVPLPEWARLSRSAMPAAHTIGSSARPCGRNGSGDPAVTVTVRAASSALVVTPGWTHRPSSGDWLAGSATKSTLAATSEAVSGLPSEQVIPSRRVKVTEPGSSCHDSASHGRSSPSSSMRMSWSYMYVPTYLVSASTVMCGSRLPGSPATAVTSVPSSTGVAAPPPRSDPSPLHAVSTSADAASTDTAVLLDAMGCLPCRWTPAVRGRPSARSPGYGPALVQEPGAAGGVDVHEGHRLVHPVAGLGRHERLAPQPDDLVPFRRQAGLGQRAARGHLHPEPARLVRGHLVVDDVRLVPADVPVRV